MKNSVSRVQDIYTNYLAKYQFDAALGKKIDGKWVEYSSADLKQNVDELSCGLLSVGLQVAEKVAIVSYNRPEWLFVDLALQRVGAVSVPIYPTITIDDYTHIFTDAGVKIVFLETQELAAKVIEATKDLEHKPKIYSFNQLESVEHWSMLKKSGVTTAALEEVEKRAAAVLPQDLFTLIYTSGTTGKPKGVMLSNNNLVSNVLNGIHLMPVDAGEKVLSFLPMCHVFERMIVYIYLQGGVRIYFAESMDTIGDNIREVQPAMFTAVPRLLEKIYDRIMDKASGLTGIKKILFYWAHRLGEQYKLNTKQGFWYDLQLKIANKLIFSKWREALGGNVKTIVSGSAPLQQRLATMFWAAQIPIMEGYGLTETSPLISVNEVNPTYNRIGTVGRIIQGVELKFAADGEILVKGPNVMLGYHQRPDATAEVMQDGWFHTGDIGMLVEGQFLKITDRKKEMFKTSGGKYVAPSLLENKFKESPIIEQIMVLGDGQKFPSALIVPNFDALKKYCAHKKISYTTDLEIIDNALVKDKFARVVEEKNKSFANYEQVKKFVILNKQWSIDGGEMTPTLKLKRKAILAKYSNEVEGIYK